MQKGKSLGGSLKERGQQRALWGESEDFLDRLINLLKDWCNDRKMAGRPRFLIEEFRLYAESKGMAPAHYNTWGAITKRARKFSSFMRRTDDTEKSKRPEARVRPAFIWIAL